MTPVRKTGIIKERHRDQDIKMKQTDMEKKKKRILLLGATGSIGTQTLDVIAQHPDQFELVGVAANGSKDKLEQIIKRFDTIKAAALVKEEKDRELSGVPLYTGQKALIDLMDHVDYDLPVNAVVGFAGLEPSLHALRQGKDLALANKESLVCGGDLVLKELEKSGRHLYPIDSEHSAIWQCLSGNDPKRVEKLLITASGGSLRDLKRDELDDITPERALKHPNWNMGARITIDSATMVNKAFEVIEAHYLFGVPFEKIETVLHPQSIIHSMVEYDDHAIMAQLGSADMRLPIQYALFEGKRDVLKEEPPLDFHQALSLEFRPMDFERYPMAAFAWKTGEKKGNYGCAFNAADEQAVSLFLNRQISFLQIEELIERALEQLDYIEHPTYEDLVETDRRIREKVRALARPDENR